MLRAIALSLFLLIGLGIVIPFVTDYAEAGAHKHHKHRKHRKYKKYSKGWWRQYHLRQQRNKAMAARRRALRLRQIRLANAKNAVEGADKNAVSTTEVQQKSGAADMTPAVLPSGESAPKGWKRGTTSPGELQFNVADESGAPVGSASISVVGPAMGADSASGQSKTVGGVQTSSLRRTVIDQMIREEGWVVNDYQKEIGGKKVFVVVAQSPGAGGRVQSRLFYFTEVDGRIYSVATNSPSNNSQRIEQESEKVVVSLQRRNGSVQQAELK